MLAATPERMVVISGLIGMISVLGGLAGSYLFDTPAGPSIICVAVAIFTLSTIRTALIHKA